MICDLSWLSWFPNSVWEPALETLFRLRHWIFEEPTKRSFVEVRSQTEFGNERNIRESRTRRMVMHASFTLCLLALVPGFAIAQDKKPAVQPIQVVKIERKDPVTYDKDIEPILIKKCQFCHSGSVQEGKLDMGAYESLTKGGKRGSPIVPGKSAD